MTSPERWDELERRLAAVEAALADRLPAVRDDTAQPVGEKADPDALWALRGLRERLDSTGDGGVVFAGTVRTSAGPVDWQYGRTTEDLVEPDDGTRELTAERLAALGHPVRVRLLLAVLAGLTSAAALARLDGLGTTGQIYHHIRTLTAAGWLTSVRRGELQLPPERVVPTLVILAAVR